jgi:hypothetical protein
VLTGELYFVILHHRKENLTTEFILMKIFLDAFTYLWDVFCIMRNSREYREPIGQTQHRGKGNMIGAQVNQEGSSVEIWFQRKIESSDVKDGCLISVVKQGVIQSGGKRVTGLNISAQAAEDLALVLTEVSRIARRKQRAKRLFGYIEALTLMSDRPLKSLRSVRTVRS